MPVTAIKIGEVRLKFMTIPMEPVVSEDGTTSKSFTSIELYQCDANFMPMGTASTSIHDSDQETYHKKLRLESLEKGHFVPEESTDLEWNPDYNPDNYLEDGASF
jgi:hypothetical protein